MGRHGEVIELSGVTTGGLPNVSLELPRNCLIAVTGPSGAGKSSLVQHTLVAEANRYFALAFPDGRSGRWRPAVEPRFERISGLRPVIEISSQSGAEFGKHTVASLLGLDRAIQGFVRAHGALICRTCAQAMEWSDLEERLRVLTSFPASVTVVVGALLGPAERKRLATGRKGLEQYLRELKVRRVIVRSELRSVDMPLPKRLGKEPIIAVVDSFSAGEAEAARVLEALGRARALGAEISAVFTLTEGVEARSARKGRMADMTRRVTLVGSLASGPFCINCLVVGEEHGEWSLYGNSVPDLLRLSSCALRAIVQGVESTGVESPEGRWGSVRCCLELLEAVGIGGVPLEREVRHLSPGEALLLRIAYARSLELSEVLIVIDEPSRLLHPLDFAAVLPVFREMINEGNTVIVVDRCREFLRSADYVVELEGGARRGAIRYSGGGMAWNRVRGEGPMEVRERKGFESKRAVYSEPVGIFQGELVAVVGRAGSGKTRFLGTLAERVRGEEGRVSSPSAFAFRSAQIISSHDALGTVRGRPREMSEVVASVLGLSDLFAELFVRTPAARRLGLEREAFTVEGSTERCPRCEGSGIEPISREWFGDVSQVCEMCLGSRFSSTVLEVEVSGRTIREVLESSVGEALAVFGAHPKIVPVLRALEALGLRMLRLGEPLRLLPPSQCVRLRLAKAVAFGAPEATLWLLEQPFADLDADDVALCMRSIRSALGRSSSVVFTTHDPTSIAQADRVVELAGGGRVVFVGRVEEYDFRDHILAWGSLAPPLANGAPYL